MKNKDSRAYVYEYIYTSDDDIIVEDRSFLCLKRLSFLYSILGSLLILYASFYIYYYYEEPDEKTRKSYQDVIEFFLLVSMFLYSISFCFYCIIKFRKY